MIRVSHLLIMCIFLLNPSTEEFELKHVTVFGFSFLFFWQWKPMLNNNGECAVDVCSLQAIMLKPNCLLLMLSKTLHNMILLILLVLFTMRCLKGCNKIIIKIPEGDVCAVMYNYSNDGVALSTISSAIFTDTVVSQ